MTKVPKKFQDRVAQRLKHFQTITASHRKRDVSEADTVTVIKDILADIFGYDKYEEVTSEYQIRGTFCDLAIKIGSKIRYLIEVKSAGTDLNDSHLRQALQYGSSEGIEWVLLTNAIDWRVYRVIFSQPVDHEEVGSFSLTEMSYNNEEHLEKMFLLAREAISADTLAVFHDRARLLNKYTVAQVLLSEAIVGAVRRELRRMFDDLKVDKDQVYTLLHDEIIKRDTLEGDKAKVAISKIKKAARKLEKSSRKGERAAVSIE
jgi:hypothetical protein